MGNRPQRMLYFSAHDSEREGLRGKKTQWSTKGYQKSTLEYYDSEYNAERVRPHFDFSFQMITDKV